MRERRTYDKYMKQKLARQKKRRNANVARVIIAAAVIAAIIVALSVAIGGEGRKKQSTDNNIADSQKNNQENVTSVTETEETTTTEDPDSKAGIIAEAKALAVQYDYDGAIELLETVEGADTDTEIAGLIEEYKLKEDGLVAIPPDEVTHVFFHSLVVDPARGFSMDGDKAWKNATPGYCQWMTTVYEFDKMMEQMYKNGYVLVSLYDMVNVTTGEDGVEYIEPKNIYLPEGKKPFVMSLDDLSYYHTYDGRGCATKMIVGDDGKPTCEYVDADGNTLVGSYDCVPRLDDFLEKHPDFSYKGAKGTIALTGYNGILGYRTDTDYRDRDEDLLDDQKAWLNAHPDFDWDKECAEAKKVAEAIKEDGWTFASHTWGHIKIGDSDMERIRFDTENWLDNVAPLIGDTDIIVFAHGQDLASWDEDYASTEKFRYMKSQGFSIFCNVDASKYFVQIGDEFLRMGRRNLDGLRLWQAVYGEKDYLSDLFDASTVIDPDRPTDESLYKN